MTEAALGEVATQAASRPSARRLAWLDALRGFAALCVVFDHTTSLVLKPLHAFLYQWFDFGQYGVFVFFLVSGYIVPASLERKGSVRGFWISRAFRLYPLYLLAIVASTVAFQLGYGTLRGGQHHPVAAVASWLLMMPNVLSGPNVPNVTWTLSYEMAFYLLLAGLFTVRAHRHSGAYALTCGIVVVALGGVLPMAALDGGSGLLAARNVDILADALIIAGIALSVRGGAGGRTAVGAWLAALTGLVLLTVNQDNYPLPWSGYTILAFMFTGTLLYRAEQGQASKVKAGVIAVVVLAMTVGGGLWHGAHHPNWNTSGAQWRWQWVTSLAGAAVTFGIAMALRNRRIPRFLAWLGVISFSLYLLHPLILDAYRDVPTLHYANKSLTVQIPLAIGLVAVAIAASAVTYYLLERPMQALGRTVARRWPDQAGAGSSHGADGAGGVGVDAARNASITNAVAGGSGGSP